MVLMEVPRSSHRADGVEPWSTAPAEDDDSRALRELEELYWTLDYGPGHRVELLEGRIEVSPKPAHWHERVVIWLVRRFDPARAAMCAQSVSRRDLAAENWTFRRRSRLRSTPRLSPSSCPGKSRHSRVSKTQQG